jgi:ParB-like chromosome segregation protein Spo0J
MVSPHPSRYKWHFEMVPIEKIFDPHVLNVDIESLKIDILKNGLKQPIQLISKGDGTYKLDDGVHRLKALKELGWKEIPAMIFDEYY